MQQEAASKQKINRHATNIRRDARHRILQQKRNEIYFQTQPIQKIVSIFCLPPKQDSQYTIVEVLKLCFQQLLYVSQEMNSMMEEMQEKKQKKGHGITAHIWFWAYLVQQFYLDKLTINQDLQVFFSQFLRKNPYKTLSSEPLLQLKIINALELVLVSPLAPKYLRIQCLKWVTGTQGLTLIYNSLYSQFLCPQQFDNVYEVLIEALKMHSLEKIIEACQIIKCIMRSADFDDTYRIYSEKGQLMVRLLAAISRIADHDNVDMLADAVIYLLDSYNSLIFDYARMGVALLATQMIRSKIQTNLFKGLQIIKFISEVQDSKTVTYLLQDNQLNESGLWYSILGMELSTQGQDISIKRETYAILNNMMSNGNYETLCSLNQLCLTYSHKGIIEQLSQPLKSEQDTTILKYILTMLSILLYYSQNYESDSQDEQGRKKEKGPQTKLYCEIMKKMIQLQIQKQLKKMAMHRNVEIAQSASKLCNDIEFVLKSQVEC